MNGGGSANLDALLAEIRSCRVCVDAPAKSPLPHAPRPVLRAKATARLAICGQAPGTRVHASGVPFSDPSGERLRGWLGVTPDEFYDESRVAILPMGFCFPGLDAGGGDLPPRRECAPRWRARLLAELPNLELVLLIGGYAQRWHLGKGAKVGVTATVAGWRAVARVDEGVAAGPARGPRFVPLPHPSWRNSGWLKRHPWFEAELLPWLRPAVRRCLDVHVGRSEA